MVSVKAKPKPSFHPTPVIVFDYLAFENMVGTLTPKETVSYLEGLRKKSKAALRYYWDNTHFRYRDVRANEFAFQVYVQINGLGNLHIWDATGLHSVGDWMLSATDVGLRLGAVKTAMNLANQYAVNGLVRCYRCKTLICWRPVEGYEPVAGTVYAGSYCPKCWALPSTQNEKRQEGT